MKAWLKSLVNNPHTSLSGLAVIVAVALYWANVITKDQMDAGLLVAVSYGLITAKDGKPNA